METAPHHWEHVNKLLTRRGPFDVEGFEPSTDNLSILTEMSRILVIGAGGLGCELLKDLALMGFCHIDVIDMDTIDISNLNRQFLFRPSDVGKPKAQVAADAIHRRIQTCQVTPHFCKIQDKSPDFYNEFHILVCGLDSIAARRWINGMAISLLQYDEDGNVEEGSIKPIVDGGTEGFKGNARVILPGKNACIECTMDLFPPQINFPLCTIAHTPRLPEHCIEYVRLLTWSKDNPFKPAGSDEDVVIDGDSPDHINWIYEKAQERANEYNILGVTYRLTQGVIKHIIPAVASTNAVISAACAMEVFKMATMCATGLNNYMVFNDTDGIYTYTFEYERKEDCLACSNKPTIYKVTRSTLLSTFRTYLRDVYNMKSPALTATIDGKNKTLYLDSIPSIEERTRKNLDCTLEALGLRDGDEIAVGDISSPKPMSFRIQYSL